MWVHGGGFFRGGLSLPEAHRVSLAIAARGIPVVSADYRLVPPPGFGWAHRPGSTVVRFPLPMKDVLDVMRNLSRESGSRLIVGGASAGACLVSSAVMEARHHGIEPLGAVLAYGFFHARTPVAPDIQRLVRGHRRVTHSRLALNLTNRNYAGSAQAWADPRAFAGGNDVRNFPPTLMIDAERDSMRASAGQFARELADADVEVDRHVLAGARHAFLNRPDEEPFNLAIDLMVDWISQSAALRR
jgi:acetyl esterase